MLFFLGCATLSFEHHLISMGDPNGDKDVFYTRVEDTTLTEYVLADRTVDDIQDIQDLSPYFGMAVYVQNSRTRYRYSGYGWEPIGSVRGTSAPFPPVPTRVSETLVRCKVAETEIVCEPVLTKTQALEASHAITRYPRKTSIQ